MSQFEGKFDDFGMDTISLAGPLKAKLAAMKAAGFTQVMLLARDLVGHPDGWEAAVQEVKDSGLRVTGFQVLRDFEGLSGHLHEYKVDIAKSMMEMCAALDCRVMLACSSTSTHATGDTDALVRDLRKLAMLAIPMNIKIAFEALSWGRTINEFPQAWDLIMQADMPNLGLGFDCGTKSRRWRSASPRRAPSACSLAKACTARPWPSWCSSCTSWATAATTALRCSTTTTSKCPCPPWPRARAAQPCGWVKTCCAAPCPSPTSCA